MNFHKYQTIIKSHRKLLRTRALLLLFTFFCINRHVTEGWKMANATKEKLFWIAVACMITIEMAHRIAMNMDTKISHKVNTTENGIKSPPERNFQFYSLGFYPYSGFRKPWFKSDSLNEMNSVPEWFPTIEQYYEERDWNFFLKKNMKSSDRT